MAEQIMGVVCILLLAFIQIACGKPNQCLEAKDSCKSDNYLTCYLNGQVVDENSCYKKVCRDTELVDEYDCPTGFQYHASGICYHVGQVQLSWEDGRSYCEKFGGLFYSDLASVPSEAIQQGIESIFETIPVPYPPPRGTNAWLGGYFDGELGWKWVSGESIAASNVNWDRDGPYGEYISTGSVNGTTWNLQWHGTVAPNWLLKRHPICASNCLAKGCTYEGKHYSYGEVVWEDPECRCTRLVCNRKGEVHLEQKEKPCCVYDGVPYGSGETIYTGKCNQLVCRNGTMISIPYCSPGYTILTYNGVASCYHISSSAMTYDDADEYCKKQGAVLAQVTSSNENNALKTELFFNLLPSGCKYGWLGATASVDSFGYLDHFQWSSGKVKGIPVEGIYEDFCAGEPPVKSEHDQFLSIVYTGSSDDNNYCWTSSDGFEKKAAICERCVVCEHIYRKSCAYNDKIYQEGQIVQSVDYAPGPCFTKTCHDGRVLRKDKVCKYTITA